MIIRRERCPQFDATGRRCVRPRHWFGKHRYTFLERLLHMSVDQ